MHARNGAIAASTVLLLVALAGCAPTGGEPSPSPTHADGTPTASPTAAPTGQEEDPADPATWVISDDGVGPVHIGGDFAVTLDGLPGDWTNDQENCGWTAWWTPADAAYGVYFVRGTESDTDPIREISVYTNAEGATGGPTTADGLGVGSTRADILAAHPDAQQGTPQIGDGEWLMLPGDGAAHVFFEFREGTDAAWDVTVTTGAEPSYEVCG